MNRILSIFLIGLLFSCSILEDSDVTSALELSKLKLTSIQVTETRNSTITTRTVPVTEEIINEPANGGGTLTRRLTYSWSALTKFQFRSAATTNITLISEYLSNGKIKFWRVKSAGVELEKYEFKYNGAGYLALLERTITTITNGVTSTTTDIDQYNIGQENFPVIRNPNSANLTIKAGFGGTPLSISDCGFKFVWQTVWNGTSWVNKKEYNYCDQDNFYIVNEGGSQGGRSQFYVISNELLEEVYLGEKQGSDGCCPDTYYFHPYLFMPVDQRVRIMYAADWWKEGTASNNGETNQSVRLKFNYE